MTVHILMPSIAPGIDTARLTRWVVDEGARIAPGDIIAEIETDTVTMEIEASQSGTLLRRFVAAGPAELAVGTPIADVEPEGLDDDEDENEDTQRGPEAGAPAEGAIATQPGAANTVNIPTPERHPITPAARAMAREADIDLTAIEGTGPGGRILKADIEARIAEREAAASQSPAVASPLSQPSEPDAAQIVQAQSAGRLPTGYAEKVEAGPPPASAPATSTQEPSAHLVMVVDCRIDELLRTRDRINLTAPPRDGRPREITLAAFYIRAAHLALALLEDPFEPIAVPKQSSTMTPGENPCALTYARMTAAGLNSRRFSVADLSDIEAIATVLASPQASDTRPKGGVTVLDLGTFRIQRAHGMITETDDVLLAIGASERRPAASGERISIATVVTATLTIDARRIDPAAAAACLEQYRALLEAPRSLLFEPAFAHEGLR